MRRTSWLAAVVLMVAVSTGSAMDYFVDNVGGSDLNDGITSSNTTARSGPVRTIAKAIRLAGPGDRIVLEKTGEPYRECVSVVGSRHSGLGGDPFTIEGNGAVLDGTQPVPGDAWQHVDGDVFRFRPSRLAYQILYRDGRPLVQLPVSRAVPALPKLAPLEWCLFDGHVYLRVEKDKLPEDYQLTHSALQTGITLYGVENVVIRDLIVQGFHFDGISAADRARDVRLADVTLRGNGRSGLSVSGASQVTLDQSVAGDNGAVQVRVEAPASLSVVQSDVLENTAPAFERPGGGRLQIDGQPVPPSR